ncbi:gamma-parvin isoform X4 [Chrysemys picta bellii]|uniref:Parvin gamma n=2 Tax=Chrysemys picta bellii TaxID=8478 RepID=A0A8C3INL4_CHRPI|nr:gamma-parvin isoform X2 [Chrysemys picta bellii]
MEPDFFTAFAQPSALHHSPLKNDVVQGEKRKFINPTSYNNPKLEELQMLLIDWINTTLKQEHIVVKSLEEDLFDGLILHHLLEKLGSLRLDVEKIALTEKKQKRKLAVILEAVAQCLQLEESQLKWNIDSIFQKDLLSTLYLLIAIAKHFQPDLPIPSNISVEVIIIERTLTGLRTENAVECITENRETLEGQSKADAFDELFTHAPDKLDDVKKFADGVILLLLIGQLGGYFLNLREFFLNPNCATEMLHNVNLAVALLTDGGLLDFPVNAEDIVNRDMKTTLQVLYCLYSKYKTKET